MLIDRDVKHGNIKLLNENNVFFRIIVIAHFTVSELNLEVCWSQTWTGSAQVSSRTHKALWVLMMWFKLFPIHWFLKDLNDEKCFQLVFRSQNEGRLSSRYSNSPEMFSCLLFRSLLELHIKTTMKMYNNFWLLESNEIFMKFYLNGRAFSFNSLERILIQLQGKWLSIRQSYSLLYLRATKKKHFIVIC